MGSVTGTCQKAGRAECGCSGNHLGDVPRSALAVGLWRAPGVDCAASDITEETRRKRNGGESRWRRRGARHRCLLIRCLSLLVARPRPFEGRFHDLNYVLLVVMPVFRCVLTVRNVGARNYACYDCRRNSNTCIGVFVHAPSSCFWLAHQSPHGSASVFRLFQ